MEHEKEGIGLLQQGEEQQAPVQLSAPRASVSQQDYLMQCKVSSTKQISTLLAAMVVTKETQWATCILTHNSIKFVVEEDKCYRATATFKKNLFHYYRYNAEQPVRFDINLSTLISCMNIYGGTAQDTAFNMAYPGTDNSLTLVLTEGNVVTDCSIRTRDASEVSTFALKDDPIKAKLLMSSDILREICSDLVWLHDNEVRIEATDELFKFGIDNSYGEMEIEVPRTSDAVQDFKVDCHLRFAYQMKYVEQFAKFLGNTQHACIRMNSRGLLSLQVKFKASGVQDGPDSAKSFEFLVVPRVQQDDGNTIGNSNDDQEHSDNLMALS